ncbi:MAG: DUF2306 domain-containing protein [Hymenobacteraceae bacterium]|nr:DUF2306 domain-containing protein [Hymenobacteraceae bacterium]
MAFFFSFDYADPAVSIPRLTHIGAGAVALFAGLVPILGRKGGALHRRAGRVYVGAMIIVALTALVLTALLPLTGGRLFLTGIAFLSFYLSFTGWRAARRRVRSVGKQFLPKQFKLFGQKLFGLAPLDTALALGTLLVGLLMVGAGLYWRDLLFSFFGGLILLFAGRDAYSAFRATPPGQPEPWVFRHISRMGGSYITTFTAFLVVNLGHWLPASAPGWLDTAGWIVPSLIGTLLIRRAIRTYSLKLKRA